MTLTLWPLLLAEKSTGTKECLQWQKREKKDMKDEDRPPWEGKNWKKIENNMTCYPRKMECRGMEYESGMIFALECLRRALKDDWEDNKAIPK
jgi:hypothetical protein